MDQNGFTLRDVTEENSVELTKKVGNVTVQVAFQSRPPQFGEENEEEEGQGIQRGQEEEDQQFDDQNFADFTVYVIQTNGKALTFECTSFDSEVYIF